MTLVTLSVDNLINGVSQQPASLRQPSQCEVQENCFDSVSSGCSKRPPRDHVATLSTSNLGHMTNVFSQMIDLGSNGQYILTIANKIARLFDLDGTEQVLTYTYTDADGDYLDLYNGATSYPESFKALSLGDYALLLNSSRTVIKTGATEAGIQSDRYLVSIKSGNYSTKYTITLQNCVNGVITNYVSSKTTSDTVISDIRTTSIADDLLSNFSPALPVSVVASQSGASIYFRRLGVDENNWMRVVVTDSRGDSRDQTNIGCFSKTVQRFTDLPIIGHTDFDQVKVIGEDASLATPYYVKFVPLNPNQNFGRGEWVETVYRGENRNNDYQLARMPYKLSKISEGNFTLSAAEWGSRTAGDDTSAPFPPFVDSTITDIGLYKNRLLFLSGDHLSFSRHGQYLDFFPSTVYQLLDTSPIVDIKSISSTDKPTGALKHAVVFDGTLVLFTDTSQLTITDDALLSPRSIPGISKKADFDASHKVRPVVAAKSIYFPFGLGRFSGVQEFFIDTVSGSADAAEITAHVKKYIEGSIIKMCASTRNNILVALGDTDKSKLSIYQWYWSGDTKLQSAWHCWPLEDGVTILDHFFYQDKLYLVIQRDDITLANSNVVPGGCHLETIDISEGQIDA